MPKRRYEILLPLTHNDGRPVSPEKLLQTRDELIERFGAISIYPLAILGVWVHEGAHYEDELRRLMIDVEDSPENRQFFADFKLILRERFNQIEVYIASFPVDII